jgi:regulator of RNase E activity RraB
MASDWDFYFLQIDDRPASIMVDLALISDAPSAGLPRVGFLTVPLLTPTAEGLSDNDEYETLGAIEDWITEQISKDRTVRLVGRYTTDGTRTFCLYHAREGQLESLAAGLARVFPGYQPELQTRMDQGWEIYLSFLYPQAADLQIIRNRQTIDALRDHGDHPDIPRQIDHCAGLPSAQNRAAFAAFVADLGFKVGQSDSRPDEDGLYWLEFARTDAPADMDQVVLPLVEKLLDLEGSYDGWGCEISR